MTALQALTPAQSQKLFGVYLRSLSEPGLIGRLPAGDTPALATAPLVLVDLLAPIAALDDAAGQLVTELAAATGAPVVEAEKARVAVAGAAASPAQLHRLRTATNFDPQTACLVIQQVDSLSNAPEADGVALELSGPGIETTTTLTVGGVGQEFVDKRNELCAEFPRGIDIFFITPAGEVAGMPRSTTVTYEGGNR